MGLTNGLPLFQMRMTASGGRRTRVVPRRRRLCEVLESRPLLTTVLIDYSLDTNNFFNTDAKRVLLQSAADALGSRLTDSLTAINPSGGNT